MEALCTLSVSCLLTYQHVKFLDRVENSSVASHSIVSPSVKKNRSPLYEFLFSIYCLNIDRTRKLVLMNYSRTTLKFSHLP